jgi:hypothetical protein
MATAIGVAAAVVTAAREGLAAAMMTAAMMTAAAATATAATTAAAAAVTTATADQDDLAAVVGRAACRRAAGCIEGFEAPIDLSLRGLLRHGSDHQAAHQGRDRNCHQCAIHDVLLTGGPRRGLVPHLNLLTRLNA